MLRFKTSETAPSAAIAASRSPVGRRTAAETAPETFAAADPAVAESTFVSTEANTSTSRQAAAASAQALREKRRRTVRRKRAAVVTLAGASLFAWRWIDANRTPTLPVLDSILTVPATMAGPNASHFYAAAADSLHGVGSTFEPDLAPLSEKQGLVAQNAETLSLLREGFRYRYQGEQTAWMHPSAQTGMSQPMPNFMNQRTLARLLAADAQVKAAAGDTAGALSASLDAVRFGRDIAHGDHAAIGGRIGSTIEGIGSREALRHVDGLSAGDARAAIARLEAMQKLETRLPDVVLAEERFGVGTYDELFNRSNLSAGLLTAASRNPGIYFGYDAAVLQYGKQGLIDNYVAAMDSAVQHATLPYQQAKRSAYVDVPSDWLNRILIPDFTRVGQSITEQAALSHILMARLAVQAYREEHGGALPAGLAELTSGPRPYLRAVPTDPFSLSGADPLRYENGKVYSVGENGQDDRGADDDEPAAR